MPRIVDKQAKREAIGRAAMQVFRETGYHRARMSDIARAAGIGKGTVYEYFEDKEEILRFEFDRYFRAFRKGASDALERVHTPRERLACLIRFALAHTEAWQDHCAVYMDYFSVARTSGSRGGFSLGELYGEMRKLLSGLLERCRASGEIHPDFDPAAGADLLIAMYDGVVLHGILEERADTSPDRIRDQAMLLISHGLFGIDQGLPQGPATGEDGNGDVQLRVHEDT